MIAISAIRVIRYVTHPFSHSSIQPVATTNVGAAATACAGGIQATLPREHDSYNVSCGYKRRIAEKHFIQ